MKEVGIGVAFGGVSLSRAGASVNKGGAGESWRPGSRIPRTGPGQGDAREAGPSPGKGRLARLLRSVGRQGAFNLKLRDCLWSTTEGDLSA